MPSRPNMPAAVAGLLAAFVGFASSFAVILQGLSAVGATRAEAASGLMALSIAMGLCGIVLSLWTKMPVSVAWSTPGAALLASAGVPAGGFPEAVGAFLVAALLVTLAGLWRPLGRAIAAIPTALANAMLAGVLFALCLAPIKAIAAAPPQGLAIFGTWLLMTRVKRLYAVPAAALTAGAIMILGHGLPVAENGILPHPVLVTPQFTLSAAIGIGIPLFLVTMASQNIPGLAILKANGFTPPPGPLFVSTGIFSALAAPFGGIAVNLAAITAAMCASDEAGPDRHARYWAGVISGLAYLTFGLAAGLITAFASLSPLLVQAVAGLALIGAFAASLNGAMTAVEEREAATLCFLVTAAGIGFLGFSAPFWGLAAGGLVLVFQRFAARG